eukprot:CAMPEP_0183391800 /NCGR_PEP_ID=MMETSP0370-20130417/6675_1 /TAXON_ID=268820 /ORGANISM="Peridinium aciculiferum, Strain PAER-2" /LENGTH=64 /DNA_ID=CAMNT_0025571579 /DNA_START=60 /DNA_END=250 /DNA_ORIENTATION=-
MSTDLQMLQWPGRASSGTPNVGCLPHAHSARPALEIMPSVLQSMQQVRLPLGKPKPASFPQGQR